MEEIEEQLKKLQNQLEEFNFQDQVEADNITMNIQQTTAEVSGYKEQISEYEDQIDSVNIKLKYLYKKRKN